MISVGKFSIKKRLSMYQVDPDGNMKPLMLMNELQSAADVHAEQIKVGISFCQENKLAWVALFYHVDIPKMPRGGQEIVLETWPCRRDGIRTIRDFLMTDAATGEVLVRASSQWVMIDMATRRPVPFEGRVPDFELNPERALDLPFDKFPDFAPDFGMEISPRYDDFDINRHVNNAVYSVWATESMGREFLGKHTLRGISLNFKKEISMSVDKVNIETADGGMKTHHRIASGDAVHAYVICDWVATLSAAPIGQC